MADWFVYRHDGDPWGPWSSEQVADAILRGEVAANVWLLPPSGTRWVCALDVPVVTALVRASKGPRHLRHDSGMRRAAKTLTSVGVPREKPFVPEGPTVTMVTAPVKIAGTSEVRRRSHASPEPEPLSRTKASPVDPDVRTRVQQAKAPPPDDDPTRSTMRPRWESADAFAETCESRRPRDLDLYARLRAAAAPRTDAQDEDDDPPTRPAHLPDIPHPPSTPPLPSSEDDPTVTSPRRTLAK